MANYDVESHTHTWYRRMFCFLFLAPYARTTRYEEAFFHWKTKGKRACFARAPHDNLHDVAPVESDRELFMSVVSVFSAVDPAKLADLQKVEFCPLFNYLRAPISAPLPNGEFKYTMSYFSLNEGLLFRSYLPDHLRKRNTSRDQLVVPTYLRKIVINSCHDLPASGGHLAFKATFDTTRNRFWRPTMSKDVHLNERLLFRSYLPGHLMKRSTFCDQLVVPTSLRKNCH